MIEHKLDSGKLLKITPAPFSDSKAVYQALLKEIKTLKLDADADIDVNLYKDLFCVALGSDELEKAIWKCMERCIYDGHKITHDTFEDVSAREDYLEVLLVVGKSNVEPFMKALMQKSSHLLEMMKKVLA